MAVLLLCMAGCMSVIRAQEDRLLKPGALDVPIPGPRFTVVKPSDVTFAGREAGFYTQYSVPFLDRYFIQYLWYGTRGCGHGGLAVDSQPVVFSDGTGVRRVSGRLYEESGRLWQEVFDVKGWSIEITRFFRSVKGQETIHATTPSGAIDAGKPTAVREREDGLWTMCTEVWVGVSQSIALRFYERSIAAWIAEFDRQWKSLGGQVGSERIGSNVWMTYTVPLQPRTPTGGIGPYKFYVLAVGDSGYTLEFGLRATQESQANPATFAALEALFYRILASVRVEPWDARTQAEYNALATQALQILKQECLTRAQNSPRSRPFASCVQFLQ